MWCLDLPQNRSGVEWSGVDVGGYGWDMIGHEFMVVDVGWCMGVCFSIWSPFEDAWSFPVSVPPMCWANGQPKIFLSPFVTTQCSKSCQGGFRVREVRCLSDDMTLSNLCDPQLKPEEKESCNPQDCVPEVGKLGLLSWRRDTPFLNPSKFPGMKMPSPSRSLRDLVHSHGVQGSEHFQCDKFHSLRWLSKAWEVIRATLHT